MGTNTFKEQVQRLFTVTDKHMHRNRIKWYGEYAIIGCQSQYQAWTVRAQLKRIGEWQYELKPGRIHKEQWYLKVIFNK